MYFRFKLNLFNLSVLSFLVLFICLKTINANAYRRLKLSDFGVTIRDYFLRSGECCGDPQIMPCKCNTILNVIVNGRNAFSIGVPSNDPSINTFLLDSAVTLEDPSLFTGDPIEIRITLHNSYGVREIFLDGSRTNIQITTEQVRNISFPGDYNKVDFSFTVELECNDYVGINCQFDCPGSGINIFCDAETGRQVCINGTSNPPECNRESNGCADSPCQNGATCVQSQGNVFTCECTSGYRGFACEQYTCESCVPTNGICTGPNTCQCLNGFTGEDCLQETCNGFTGCKNGGLCRIENEQHLCICDNSTSFGFFCQTLCVPACVHGVCYSQNNQGLCLCDEFYFGKSCSETYVRNISEIIPPEISYNHQTLGIILTPILLLIFVVVTLGLAVKISNVRKAKKTQKQSELVMFGANSIVQNTMRSQMGMTMQNPMAMGMTMQNPMAMGMTMQNPMLMGMHMQNPMTMGMPMQNPMAMGMPMQNPMAMGMGMPGTMNRPKN